MRLASRLGETGAWLSAPPLASPAPGFGVSSRGDAATLGLRLGSDMIRPVCGSCRIDRRAITAAFYAVFKPICGPRYAVLSRFCRLSEIVA